MIDSAAESPADLRRIAAMLTFMASQAEMAPLAASVPAGTVVPELPRPSPTMTIVPSPPVEVMKADAGHASELPQAPSPAEAFGGASNVVPLVPPPPSVGSAAAPPAAAPTTEAVSTAVDGAGFPWDERIHSTPATQNANGLWRMRRSTAKNPVTPELIQSVEAEMRAKGYGKPLTPAPLQTTIPTAPAAPTVPLPPTGAVAPDVPAPPVAGVIVPSVPTPPAPVSLPGNGAPGVPPSPAGAGGVPSGADAFRSMMDKFSKEMGPNGRLNKAAIAPYFATIGVSGWGELHKKPELIPGVVAECERLTAATA